MPVRPSLRVDARPAPVASVPSDKPFWTTSDGDTVRLFLGDVIGRLKALPAKSVQCVITSPPYWGLRDYGTGQWEGGDSQCAHKSEAVGSTKESFSPMHGTVMSRPSGWRGSPRCSTTTALPVCKSCGAVRVEDHQLGSEARPDCGAWASGGNCAEGDGWYDGCHVCRMTLVFREVRRVLRDDGVCAINYGDTYVDNQLQLIPARIALALQADGWLLRSDIPWVKLSAMPESARNRPCKALEYVYLFAKVKGYFWDCDAIRKNSVCTKVWQGEQFKNGDKTRHRGQVPHEVTEGGTRNFRNADLWFESVDGPHGLTGVGDEVVGIDVTSESYGGAHFAAFGSRLITPFVLAGTSQKGACAKCGAPWRRVTDRVGGVAGEGREEKGVKVDRSFTSQRNGKAGSGSTLDGTVPRRETVAWEPTCTCHGRFEKRTVTTDRKARAGTGVVVPTGWAVGTGGNTVSHNTVEGRAAVDLEAMSEEVERTQTVYISNLPLDRHPVVPCVVMDPFVGSGTTCAVAVRHGRRGWGIDLSETYLRDHAVKRVTAELLSRPATAHLVPRPPVVRGKGTAMVLGGGKPG